MFTIKILRSRQYDKKPVTSSATHQYTILLPKTIQKLELYSILIIFLCKLYLRIFESAKNYTTARFTKCYANIIQQWVKIFSY